MSGPIRFIDVRAAHQHASAPNLQRGAQVAAEIPELHAHAGLLDAALWWLDAGYTLLPLLPANHPGRGDGQDPAKIPNGKLVGSGNGIDGIGSNRHAQIVNWWTRQPHGNIGINVPRSRILIIDVDPKHNGWNHFLPWCEQHDIDLSEVPRSASPRGDGGVHLYWRLPDDAPTYSWGVFLTGVDRPWQVPVPPSQRLITFTEPGSNRTATAAKPYQWIAGDPRDLPTAPTALLGAREASVAPGVGQGGQGSGGGATGIDVLPRTEYGTIDESQLEGLPIPVGEQNLAFKSIAAKGIRNNRSDREIIDQLMRQAACSPVGDPSHPWTVADMQRITSAAKDFVEKERRKELLAAEARGGKKLTLLERAQRAGLI